MKLDQDWGTLELYIPPAQSATHKTHDGDIRSLITAEKNGS